MKGDDALLVEVLMHLGRVEFIEQILMDKRKKYRSVGIAGATEGRRVYVNPLHHKRKDEVVSTLLHEGIHRAHWDWQEKRVERAEKRLLDLLNDEQVEAIHKAYKQAVRRLRGIREDKYV